MDFVITFDDGTEKTIEVGNSFTVEIYDDQRNVIDATCLHGVESIGYVSDLWRAKQAARAARTVTEPEPLEPDETEERGFHGGELDRNALIARAKELGIKAPMFKKTEELAELVDAGA